MKNSQLSYEGDDDLSVIAQKKNQSEDRDKNDDDASTLKVPVVQPSDRQQSINIRKYENADVDVSVS